MKPYEKKRKSRVDIYDIVDDLENLQTLAVFPFPQEYELVCPVKGRPETATYCAMTSWGDLCHISIQFRPFQDNIQFMHARIEFKLRLKDPDTGVLYAYEEDTLDMDQFTDYRGNVMIYRIGPFLFEVKRPFALSRLIFRGFLTDAATKTKKFATINLFMSCIGKVYDNLAEFDVEFVKNQTENKQFELEDSYEQWIQMKGQIKLEDAAEARDLFLWGLFIKTFETYPVTLNHFIAWNDKGMAFHIVQLEANDKTHKNKEYVYGHVNMGLGIYFPLTVLPKIQLNDIEAVKNCKFDIDLPKIKRNYPIEITGDHSSAVKFDDDLWAFPLKLKDYDGYGFWYRQNLQNTPIKTPPQNVKVKNILENYQNCNFVGLSDEFAKSDGLTGGKGSSLSVLDAFSHDCPEKFVVPGAIVVTTEAYQKFLDIYPALKESVQNFPKRVLKCCGNQGEIKIECEKMQEHFKKHSFPDQLIGQLKDKMESVFGEDFEQIGCKFAVRSSAVGEDSEEMSAAGQMSSFLGVSGFEAICHSIIACWASQFAQTAMEYKRGYGQKINSPMGVVVQLMVSSEVAGVMFTCSPLDGNERYITISANYGLGESVVSGQVEPDTFTVKVDVDSDRRSVLCVENVRIGTKKHAIHMKENTNTETEQVSQTEQTLRCLNDEQVLQLARIGLEVQRHYGNARDIEFGLSNGVWYMLQSRPVTNLTCLSEWEAMHEMDTGHLSENECMSRANVGEVIPGASSYNLANFLIRPWTSMTFAMNCKVTGQSLSDFNPYFNVGFAVAYNIMFFALKTPMGIMGRKTAEDTSPFIHGFEYALLGHKNEDVQLFKDIFEKMPDQKRTLGLMMRMFGLFIKNAFTAHKLNKIAYKEFEHYTIRCDTENPTSKEIFEKVCQELPKTRETSLNHMRVSQVSMFHNASLYHFLFTKSGIKDEQQILDLFSRITSSVDDVFSANVPKKLLTIADEIVEPEKFLELSDEEAIKWLKENNKKFNEFLIEFGHRGYKEFDLHALQWAEDSRPLIHSLRSLLKTRKDSITSVNKEDPKEEENHKQYNLDDYPQLSFMQKKILRKFLIPKTHRGIRNRELGKNLLVKTYDQFRKMFYLLGDKLVEEGKIPDRELVFFFMNEELQEIIEHETKPLKILNAKNRLRLHPKKESFRYDEVTSGYEMKPRNFLPKKAVPIGAVKLTGVPISSGRIVARCCVAETLEEAKNIQRGDILITYSTDIGWSPYFAALGGLVTEIGGLVSHGAVIAREYGLPCLVGVDDATSCFTTGDMLLLDTSAGFVAKIEPEDHNSSNHQ